MQKKIRFANGTELEAVSVCGLNIEIRGATRETLKIEVKADHDQVINLFVDGASFSIVDVETIETYNKDAFLTEEKTIELEYDKSDYSIAGEVIDYRDGRCTVFMGKPTEVEVLRAETALYKELLINAGVKQSTIESAAMNINLNW